MNKYKTKEKKAVETDSLFYDYKQKNVTIQAIYYRTIKCMLHFYEYA